MRIKATVFGGLRFPLRRHRVTQFDRNPAQKVMGLRVLRVATHRVAQVDLG